MARKIILFVLLVVMISSSVCFAQGNNTSAVSDQENTVDTSVKNTIENFFNLYYESIRDLKIKPEIAKIMGDSDSGAFITRLLKYKIEQYSTNPMTSFEVKYKYKDFKIDDNTATAKVYVWCSFKYENSPDVSSGMGSYYTVAINNINNSWIITELDSDEFEFIPYKIIKEKSSNNMKSEINKLFDEKESDYKLIKSSIVNQADSEPQLDTKEEGAIVTPMESYTYNATKGSSYASHYADWSSVPSSEELFWYEDGADCTNFVSQCVWAAYGGWIEGYDSDTITNNAANIKKDVRQVTRTWYGSKSNVGSGKWCRVVEFHDFAINTSKTKGPFASTYGNKTPGSFSPSDIKKGDVLQFIVDGYAGGNYGHSIYVTKAGTTWDNIKICCHSTDRENTSLSEFINDPSTYTKMRRIRFTTGKFDS